MTAPSTAVLDKTESPHKGQGDSPKQSEVQVNTYEIV